MGISISGASAPKSDSNKKTGGSMSFLKKGAAAKQALTEAVAKAEAAKAEAGKLWRFMINKKNCGEDYKITFLDGSLDEEGALDVPMWNEHTIQLGGKWKNVPCTSHEEPCPVCANDDQPTLIAGFTIIDHTPYTIQNGANAGKTLKRQRKLFTPKRTTLAQLQKLATKYGGLVGTTWEVSRSNDKSANTGDMFQFVEKQSLAELKKLYGEDAEPADFNEEVTYYTRDELIAQGVKGASKKVGTSEPSEDLDEELGG
jgi:hypothetical protein